LTNEIFKEEEAVSICGLAISPNRQQDQMVWIGTQTRNFDYRSADHLKKRKRFIVKKRKLKDPKL
jgi:hypothetical protein